MLSYEQFVCDKVLLTSEIQFQTFFDGIGMTDKYNGSVPTKRMFIYKGYYFIYEMQEGKFVLEISNCTYVDELDKLEVILLEWYNNECDTEVQKMKTDLPTSIRSVDEAETFFTKLNSNGELFDPFDNPALVLRNGEEPLFTPAEAALLRPLIAEILSIPGFDAHEFILTLPQ